MIPSQAALCVTRRSRTLIELTEKPTSADENSGCVAEGRRDEEVAVDDGDGGGNGGGRGHGQGATKAKTNAGAVIMKC
ncbi:hypothetical protein P691DRAFT_810398 [Macrolepiota fuliginosa MF-IS2]|uniref:Uncharacterized protein n=1 Tax=Macrolepiota fuliginosa MF-IS2 TaxID=1400762 RepID=A0A9P5X3K9_9AGAR|nr:hypothetical protein P691DRAFT_810398 [Macrolepiota fuliginosa MF-IS2]